jgi:hypothetical protein
MNKTHNLIGVNNYLLVFFNKIAPKNRGNQDKNQCQIERQIFIKSNLC